MTNLPIGEFSGSASAGGFDMELAGHGSYRQLAEEIGGVLQAAAETAEKMQDDARADAARIRAEAEAEHRTACAEGRRILDDARMEADMMRAEAEWQAQEILAQARRLAAERVAGADSRLAEVEKAESRVLDRLAGVGQVLADAMASLREGQRETASVSSASEIAVPDIPAADDDNDRPSAKVYFVEFPPAAPPAPAPATAVAPSPAPGVAETTPAPAPAAAPASEEIVVIENPDASLFGSDEERSEWAPPAELPTWWTRDGAHG